MINNTDLKHLRRCVELAKISLEKGDEPFGSILVSSEGRVLAEDHNHVAAGDHTPMCAAAHGWVGLGRIVYASSSQQLVQWLDELGVAPSRVRNLPIEDVIRDTIIEGPVPELAEEVHNLHRQFHTK